MLMHHADAEGIGIIGVVDLDNFAVFLNGPLLSLIQAEQDTHQGGLSGAVFPQQGVDFAGFQLKGHIIIGDDSRKTLGNVQHFYCIGFVAQSNYLLFVTTYLLYTISPRISNSNPGIRMIFRKKRDTSFFTGKDSSKTQNGGGHEPASVGEGFNYFRLPR